MGVGQNNNTLVNPLAAQAMEKFKYEVANEIGLNAPQSGYWGELTSRDCGAVGGHMVRKMVEAYENQAAGETPQQQNY
ncbi:MAG: small, acid-soluble spore protein, alpha/beta type [Bacillota bacterium]